METIVWHIFYFSTRQCYIKGGIHMKKRVFMLAMIGVLSLTGVPQATIIGNSATITAEAATRLSVPNGLTSIGRTYAQKIIS